MNQPTLEVVAFVREHGLDALTERYGIKQRRHGEFPNLVGLNYDQVKSPLGEKIVQQCRGIILDEADNWRVVCYPFDKFFNYGEGHAAQIDWATARVEEKLDGTLCTWYWYGGKWNVATRGVPDASVPLNNTGLTFAQLFERTRKANGYHFPAPGFEWLNFMFELVTPENRVVVHNAEPRLVLIGVRSKDSLKEYDLLQWSYVQAWPHADFYPLQTLEDVVAAAAQLEGHKNEGFVVRDAQFNRIKVKSPAYVALAHSKDAAMASDKNMLRLVLTNEGNEFLSVFPELKERYEGMNSDFVRLCGNVEATFSEIKSIEAPREFAERAKPYHYSAALFALRNGKVSDAESFYRAQADRSIDSVLQTLGYKETQLAV